MEERKKMRTIWFFVGIVLVTYGVLVLLAGIINFFNPPQIQTALAHLQPNLWWGGFMILSGGLFLYFTRNMFV